MVADEITRPPAAEDASAPAVRRGPTVTSVVDLIGETPMLELRRFEPEGRGQIFAKLEWLTPGGSVKDRTGVGLLDWGEKNGHLKPGGTIIEPTAGNTGIGIALVGVQRGYKVILCVPEGYAIEKIKLMEALGATVVPTSRDIGIKGAIEKCYEIAADIPGAYVPQQFESPGNALVHEETTGPEIWRQTGGRLDAVCIGVGSGGTFSGVARYLKRQNPDVHCVAVETNGSVLQGGEPGPHEVEGIGTSFIPDVLDTELMDEVIMVHDDDSFRTAKDLALIEGLLVAGSSGANVFAALTVARRLGPESRVATILCDSAERYLSKGRLGGPPTD
ncbi:MAG: cysteine synthase family protein [Acidobacteriota bacterium]